LEALLERWRTVRSELDRASVRLIAVSKYAPDEAVDELIRAGETEFGESRPQQLRDRQKQWPDCHWHMIGPVQKNKARYIARHAAIWHSCEDIETARAVASRLQGRRLPVLIQVNLSGLAHQHGVKLDETPDLAERLRDIEGLELIGLMGMAPRVADVGETEVARAFARLRGLRDRLFGGSLGELCMGMSQDYRLAIAEGATMVRLGSTLFGNWQQR